MYKGELFSIDLHEFVESLSKGLESKDLYTSGHSERVAHLSKKIATSMGLKKEKVFITHIAGHLHDIGKIGIKDSILNKKGKLTLEEYNQIKKHSKIGYEILSKVNVFKKIAQIVKYHHEKYDGTGYPRGIKGKNIPLESRIIAVADAFDAMTSPRPYREILSISQAIKELNLNKKRQFDSNIVTVMNHIYKQEYDFLKMTVETSCENKKINQ